MTTYHVVCRDYTSEGYRSRQQAERRRDTIDRAGLCSGPHRVATDAELAAEETSGNDLRSDTDLP